MKAQRTYWHLQDLQRKPSAYDIGTSRLLYYAANSGRGGLEVPTPAAAWIERYQRGSAFQARDWESFRDPRETTYALYIELQRKQETYVDGLFQSIEQSGYDKQLPQAWIETLERILPTLRFPLHGLQMASAYVGHLAPSGRIVVAALLQTGDEIRRIQRIAYRMRQLQETWVGFGEGSLTVWQSDASWQPLRALIEKLLVTYDWGESLIALNFCLKPAFDQLFTAQLARAAERQGDALLGRLLFSFEDDCRWHRDWSRALVNAVLEDSPQNVATIAQWQDAWRPQVDSALAPLVSLVG